MKQKLLFMPVTLIFYCIVLQACTPDVPPESMPRYIDGLQFNPDNFRGPGVLTSISPDGIPCIAGQGNCTMILPSSPNVSQDMSVLYYTFKRYCSERNTIEFFSKVKNWDKLLPGLKQDSALLNGIMNGSYKIQSTGDDNAIVIYKGLSPATGNIIKAYAFNSIH